MMSTGNGSVTKFMRTRTPTSTTAATASHLICCRSTLFVCRYLVATAPMAARPTRMISTCPIAEAATVERHQQVVPRIGLAFDSRFTPR